MAEPFGVLASDNAAITRQRGRFFNKLPGRGDSLYDPHAGSDTGAGDFVHCTSESSMFFLSYGSSTKLQTLCVLMLAAVGPTGWAHDGGHGGDHLGEHTHRSDQTPGQDPLITGQDAMQFSWDRELTDCFPDDARPFEPRMHGGFNEDPQTKIIYTGIPQYGLCEISPDLKEWKRIGTSKLLKANIHGIDFFVHHGEKRLALAQNNSSRVLIVDLDGEVLHTLETPTGEEFDFPAAKEYYAGDEVKFAPTDVTYLDGRLYVTTGYSPGDFVLTASENDGVWSWGKIAWGGRGDGPSELQTGHGIFAYNGSIYVASRAASRVIQFSPEGELIDEFDNIPESALVCNIARHKDLFFVNALRPIGEQKTAPIYAHTGDELVSTIVPGELRIPVLRHLHHVWPHTVTSDDGSQDLYLLIHGWNKGKYAVLKHRRESQVAKEN